MYRTLFYVFLFKDVSQKILFKMLNIQTDPFWFSSSHFHIVMLSNSFKPATRRRVQQHAASFSYLSPAPGVEANLHSVQTGKLHHHVKHRGQRRSHCQRIGCKMMDTFLWMYSWEMTLRIWSIQSYSIWRVKKSRTIKLSWESQKTTAACRQKVQSGPAGVVSAVPRVASTPRTSPTLLQSRNPADGQPAQCPYCVTVGLCWHGRLTWKSTGDSRVPGRFTSRWWTAGRRCQPHTSIPEFTPRTIKALTCSISKGSQSFR